MSTPGPRSRRGVRLPAVLSLVGLLSISAGCRSDAGTGAFAGAGIGALAGQAIGDGSEATVSGSGVGAGIGYLLGSESDKRTAEEMSRESVEQQYRHAETGPLGGTVWRIVSFSPREILARSTSCVLQFRRDGTVITTKTRPDGSVTTDRETYRVVGSTLIINRARGKDGVGYIVNVHYQVHGDQMIVAADDFRAVLQRL